MFKVIVTEDINEKGIELLQKCPDIQVETK